MLVAQINEIYPSPSLTIASFKGLSVFRNGDKTSMLAEWTINVETNNGQTIPTDVQSSMIISFPDNVLYYNSNQPLGPSSVTCDLFATKQNKWISKDCKLIYRFPLLAATARGNFIKSINITNLCSSLTSTDCASTVSTIFIVKF